MFFKWWQLSIWFFKKHCTALLRFESQRQVFYFTIHYVYRRTIFIPTTAGPPAISSLFVDKKSFSFQIFSPIFTYTVNTTFTSVPIFNAEWILTWPPKRLALLAFFRFSRALNWKALKNSDPFSFAVITAGLHISKITYLSYMFRYDFSPKNPLRRIKNFSAQPISSAKGNEHFL